MTRRQSSVSWPKRAVVTAGMPYGNKALHFGHVGGVFVPADCFARFLRDRIGAENVRFVSGTDCYGSPINEGYRKEVEAGTFSGTISDYVLRNHNMQKATLDAYDISLDMFEGSGIGHCASVHQETVSKFLRQLYDNGFLHKRQTMQFYDPKAKTFLNGRQVVGRCPVQGCKSEHAYADECDLGHQYAPSELIAPHSTLTGVTPEMRPVANWYFDLPAFHDFLQQRVEEMRSDPDTRALIPDAISEFLQPPIMFVKNEEYDSYTAIKDALPHHIYTPAQGNKKSFQLTFDTIDERDVARNQMKKAGIRFRTGKTLVPFRITGNIAWGVKSPNFDGKSDHLTIWCWPESLIAPISFTIAANDKLGLPREEWRKFWCSDDARVYQFMGQDNIYFYGVAQPALWQAMRTDSDPTKPAHGNDLRQTDLVANYHILFNGKKASSSSKVKPPSADDLLNHYTVEQLRAHWLSLGLDQKSVSFEPKAYETDPKRRSDPRVSDPVLKEGALLTKVFNRLARSCLYEAKNQFDGYIPLGKVSKDVADHAQDVMDRYERIMEKQQLHSIMSLMDEFIRWSNKYWSAHIKHVINDHGEDEREQVLIDSCYLLRICTLLMHPVVPSGCEKICDYLNFDPEKFFTWDAAFDGLGELCGDVENEHHKHAVKILPPRFDFFSMHPSQMKQKKQKK